MLRLEHITIKYNERVIFHDLSYSFQENKIYGLIGRNGAGKTTLLKTIARLKKEEHGDIFWGDVSIKNKDYFDLDATFISDDHSFFQDLTMYEQMLFLCKIKGLQKTKAQKKIEEIVDLFKLGDYIDYFPHALSRGTLQRFGIAFGYLRGSKLLLLDEPFITLDPIQVNTLEKLLISQKSPNRIIVVSSHDLDSLEAICDEYLIIKDKNVIRYLPNEIGRSTITQIIGDSYE
ncbi:ABC transporter ATP-binding protein [Anoxybacillus flavithermus]|uniref:ABC transporter ATP-binding protein n=1 Tax=Anoxybacillus flavithermus TaxID=33934 RepID=A0A2G5RMZ2_9BACL|nr:MULTISPECIES: ABC transporter ATP-binding protein [Anoxybacillus]KFZ43511.1 hypothetical protein JS80_02960 [Anoxybacillus sp. KU2-6(11)]PIC04052.1 ABC transporter ATP-binding protein [Anoxybacillus flavithermus]